MREVFGDRSPENPCEVHEAETKQQSVMGQRIKLITINMMESYRQQTPKNPV